MGNVLETQKVAMSDEVRIAKKEFRVSLFTEGIEQVLNTNLNKTLQQEEVHPVFSEERNCPVMCTDYDSSLAVQ